MAANPAVNSMPVQDSPHVLAATHVRRGMTPAVWADDPAPGYAGVWDIVNPGGPADRDSGLVTGSFDSGPGRWKQM